jgi:hypothetical protein
VRTNVIKVQCSRCKRETIANVDPENEPMLDKWGYLNVCPISAPRGLALVSGDLCPRCCDALQNWMKLLGPNGNPLNCAVEGCTQPNIGRGSWCLGHTGED